MECKRPPSATAVSNDLARARSARRVGEALKMEARKRALQIYARMLTFWDEQAVWAEDTCGAEMVPAVMHEVAELLRTFPLVSGGGDDDGNDRSA